MTETPIRAVFWDFGGVILSSPFESFNRYETSHNLPLDLIRQVNATNPHNNAWARLERSDITTAQFDQIFAEESEALGHRVSGSDVLALLSGEIRPQMVAALDAVKSNGYAIACLTNNVVNPDQRSTPRHIQVAAIMAKFDQVVESSKVGCRKPEPRFYEIACELTNVLPTQCVFLDDLGVNLKPAAAMGMRTIKVGDPDVALDELEVHLGISLH